MILCVHFLLDCAVLRCVVLPCVCARCACFFVFEFAVNILIQMNGRCVEPKHLSNLI